MQSKLLHIYLADHHAASIAGIELAKRCLSSNRSGALGDFLSELTEELEEDQDALEILMEKVGARPSPLKGIGAWTAEKAGRLKLNGRLTGYSPLSKVVELEALQIGVTGKLAMWEALDALAEGNSELDLAAFDFKSLIRKAKSQHEQLEKFRLEAVAAAFD